MTQVGWREKSLLLKHLNTLNEYSPCLLCLSVCFIFALLCWTPDATTGVKWCSRSVWVHLISQLDAYHSDHKEKLKWIQAATNHCNQWPFLLHKWFGSCVKADFNTGTASSAFGHPHIQLWGAQHSTLQSPQHTAAFRCTAHRNPLSRVSIPVTLIPSFI